MSAEPRRVVSFPASPSVDDEFARADGRRKPLQDDLQMVGAREFIEGFKPHRDVVKGLLRGEYVYALTAPTNAGKTALFVNLAMALTQGHRFGGLETRPGNVLMLVGENPYDVKPRLLAACQEQGIEPGELSQRLFVMPQAFPMMENYHKVQELANQAGEFVAVLVDTSPAYYHGDNEDDNVQSKEHALALRALTCIAGNPAVVVACHPRKHATRDELEPRGGSAFINELDGNLVCFSVDGLLTLHWQKKLRQPAFDPLHFQLRSVKLEGVEHEDGSAFYTVVASPITADEADQIERHTEETENRVLYEINRNPTGGMREWAAGAGLSRWKVEQAIAALKESKLLRKHRRKWVLTEAGKQEADRVK